MAKCEYKETNCKINFNWGKPGRQVKLSTTNVTFILRVFQLEMYFGKFKTSRISKVDQNCRNWF